jgi:hypothetical protein
MYGFPASNPTSQQAGTVFLRVFAQAKKKEDISAEKFKIPIYALRMQSYPGYHMNLDFRAMDAKSFMEIFPVVVSMASPHQETHILGSDRRKAIAIDTPTVTAKYPYLRNSYKTINPTDIAELGTTQLAPLGSIVHAQSGDKVDNANIGFFVQNMDEYSWLQSLLTIPHIIILFGDEWTKGDNILNEEWKGASFRIVLLFISECWISWMAVSLVLTELMVWERGLGSTLDVRWFLSRYDFWKEDSSKGVKSWDEILLFDSRPLLLWITLEISFYCSF